MREPVSSSKLSPSERPETVAYVLMGYPRLSETFISSEIYRVERAGLPLRLFVLKHSSDEARHGVVERTTVSPVYLPPVASITRRSARRWLAKSLRPYGPKLWNMLRRRPLRVLGSALRALAEAARARPGNHARPRRIYLRDFFWAVALAEGILAAEDVTHLHAHFCHGTTTVTWLASLITGIPFSFTAHAKDIYLPALNPSGMLPRKLRAARFAVTCTEANRRRLVALEPKARVHRIYHGLNDDFERLLREQPRIRRASNGPLRILSVGRFVPKKGLDLLIDACAFLEDSGIEFEARIVGEADRQGPVLADQIAERNLAHRVQLLPPMLQSQLYDEYGWASLFCLPCRIVSNGDRDGIPNVLLEAMATGLPVITTPVSGIPELLVNEENGLLVPPEDPPAIAQAIRRLHEDPALAKQLGQQARSTTTKDFDADASAHALASLLRGAAGANS